MVCVLSVTVWSLFLLVALEGYDFVIVALPGNLFLLFCTLFVNKKKQKQKKNKQTKKNKKKKNKKKKQKKKKKN